MRTVLVALTIAALLGGAVTTAGAEAASPAKQVKRLKAKVTRLDRDRDRWRARANAYRSERDRARAALYGDLATRITEVSRAGRISDLHRLVFEPIRTNWLCGSTVFQGQYGWSINVDLEYSDFQGDDLVKRSCRG